MLGSNFGKSQNKAMKLSELKYSKSEINKAGRFFRQESQMSEDAALDILNNWRAAHSYPMQVFYVRLKRTSESLDDGSLVAQRLKRASSILAKLRRKYHGRNPSMDLYQMQDIAGCRAILSNVGLAKKLADREYVKKKGDIKHKLVGTKDYISFPKSDGYRGIHLIYSYKSDKANKMKYNGLLVEVQMRTKLQHIWATAVETVDFFTRQAIKSSEGSPDWMEFFRLVSSAFARIESCPTVPNTPLDEEDLYSRISQKEQELSVINKVKGWTNVIQIFDERTMRKGAKFFLLELNIKNGSLAIYPFAKKDEQKALDMYASLEKKYAGNKEYDVVLTGVEAAHDLRKAYPNYYVDMTDFLKKLQSIIQKVKQ